jgi:hypothetical protein
VHECSGTNAGLGGCNSATQRLKEARNVLTLKKRAPFGQSKAHDIIIPYAVT